MLFCLFAFFASCSNSIVEDVESSDDDIFPTSIPIDSSTSIDDEDTIPSKNPDAEIEDFKAPDILISEVLPHNLNYLDEFEEKPGWIELYNTTNSTIHLKGYSLTEKKSNPRKWSFGNDSIEAKSYKIIFCDNKNTGNHTNWKLNDQGGEIFLIDPKGNIEDSLSYPELPSGISYGRNSAGDFVYYETPSPNQSNILSQQFSGISQSVKQIPAAGFYASPITIIAPSHSQDETIRCTQDGSEPTEASPAFDSPITIRQNTVLRCATFKSGTLTKKFTTRSYFINESVKMPVISISVDPEFFKTTYYHDNHSCSNPDSNAGYLSDTEYPIHLEYFEKGSLSKSVAFEIDAGISIAGGCTRYYPKKSVDIKIREKYQPGKLKYSLFETRPEANSFKSFRLRNLGNRFYNDFVGDAAFTNLLEETNLDYQRSQRVIVFYNGEYYGIHDIREKLDADYIENNYGKDHQSVSIIEHHNGKVSGNAVRLYNNLQKSIDKINTSNSSKLYNSIKMDMDINNFANYMAFEIYSVNNDWPGNNVKAWKSSNTPWRFFVYDIDYGFDMESKEAPLANENMFQWIRSKAGSWNFANFYTKLIQVPDFKRAFINHSAIMFNSFITASKVCKSVDNILSKTDITEMERDLQRFPRSGITMNGDAIKQWAIQRDISVREDYRKEFNLEKDIKVSIKAIGNGTITVDGMKLPSQTNFTNYTGIFFGGNNLLLEAHPINNSVFNGWNDGNLENPRLVSPQNNDIYEAIFK